MFFSSLRFSCLPDIIFIRIISESCFENESSKDKLEPLFVRGIVDPHHLKVDGNEKLGGLGKGQ